MNSKMNKLHLFLLSIIISSCSTNPRTTIQVAESENTEVEILPKVTGIGGIFFRSKNPENTSIWYQQNLGLVIDENLGSPIEFRNAHDPEKINYLRWNLFIDSTDYFQPSHKEFMINYRVQNIEGLVKKLRDNNVTITDKITTYDYGKFVHIMDPEGNKIELWEPVDSFLTKIGGETTK